MKFESSRVEVRLLRKPRIGEHLQNVRGRENSQRVKSEEGRIRRFLRYETVQGGFEERIDVGAISGPWGQCSSVFREFPRIPGQCRKVCDNTMPRLELAGKKD